MRDRARAPDAVPQAPGAAGAFAALKCPVQRANIRLRLAAATADQLRASLFPAEARRGELTTPP